MNKARVILLTLLAACAYGVLHDQVTVRLCIEYFTVAHPPLFQTTSPTLLALCWGITATLGVGIALGVLLALVSQSGEEPPYPIPRLGRQILVLLAAMAVSAFAAGWAGYFLSQGGFITIPDALAGDIPEARHHRFMAAWFAHGASYLVGLSGGGGLCFRIWKERGRPRVLSVFPRTRGAALRAMAVAALAAAILWMRFGAH